MTCRQQGHRIKAERDTAVCPTKHFSENRKGDDKKSRQKREMKDRVRRRARRIRAIVLKIYGQIGYRKVGWK